MGSRRRQGMAFDSTLSHWEASDVRTPLKRCDEKHRSILVDSSGDHERTGDLPEKT